MINDLAPNNLVKGLPKLSFKKDHLCSACELSKMTHATLKSKPEPSSVAPLHLLHMDLCRQQKWEEIYFGYCV